MHVKCTLGVYDAYGAWLGGGAWELGAVTEGMLAAAGDAVSLGITMLGVMAFWTGILEIGRRAGLIEQLSVGMRPVLHFLFHAFQRVIRRFLRWPPI